LDGKGGASKGLGRQCNGHSRKGIIRKGGRVENLCESLRRIQRTACKGAFCCRGTSPEQSAPGWRRKPGEWRKPGGGRKKSRFPHCGNRPWYRDFRFPRVPESPP